MKGTAIVAVLGLAAAAFAGPAAAQNGYLGFSAGQSKFRFSGCDSPCDDKGKAYKLFGGYQFNRYAAIEAGYSDFGKATFGSAEVKANAWEVSGVGTWGIPIGAGGMGFSVLGRLGIYNGDVKATVPSTGAEAKHGTTDLTFGLGLQVDLSRIIAVRGEWQRFSKMGGGSLGEKADVDALSVGALWRF
ncbi:MAG TPA: outer membrane beta-barrel protein [Burkholderiales bacterium]|nr:outer membrane beta-barrel protein [Burkholderiales bacterium]